MAKNILNSAIIEAGRLTERLRRADQGRYAPDIDAQLQAAHEHADTTLRMIERAIMSNAIKARQHEENISHGGNVQGEPRR